MILPRPVLLAARAAFVAFFMITSIYALLAFIPFSYLQFLRHDLVPWVSAFARWHHLLYWPAMALGVATLWEDRARGRGLRRAVDGLAVAGAVTGLALLVHPLLPRLSPGALSAATVLAALVPMVWAAAIDAASSRGATVWSAAGPGEDRRLFRAAVLSALFMTIVYAGVAHVRAQDGAGASSWSSASFWSGAAVSWGSAMTPVEAIGVLLWSAVIHLGAFCGVFVLLALVRGLAAFSARPAWMELWGGAVLLGAGVALVWRRLIFASLSFSGPAASLFAVFTGAAVAGSLAGLALRLRRRDGGEAASGFEVLLAPLGPRGSASRAGRGLWFGGIALFALLLGTAAGRQDWNYLLQKIVAIAVCGLTFSALYAAQRRGDRPIAAEPGRTRADGPGPEAPRGRRRTPGPARFVLAAAAVALAYRGLQAGGGKIAAALGVSYGAVARGIDRHAGHDASFRLLRDAFSAGAPEDPGFYRFLERHTNIARDVPIAPVDIDLVPSLRASPGSKPSIFLIVIDSLRRDYLSPYNPSITFTPAIGRFASESVVFRRAFTHYGATGLSEPSIWVGGLLVHKQYVTPFAPMNALEKLIHAEGYEMLLSMDSILRAILSPWPALVDLDEGIPNKDYGLCRTLASLREKLAATDPGGRPVFVYTQPQDIHISVIARQGASVPAGESYPGLHAPYASRIRRMDACFGELIDDLKRSGRYENSIVILTSDHGDSLGEEGRWGHAYTLFPEIVRIPLIVHIPASMRERLTADPEAVVFTTDLTPTLYALLGHPPTRQGGLFGRPLFTETIAEQAGRGAEEHLLASSYGPVYGILRDGGRSLYIVDGINYTDDLFDLGEDAGGARRAVTSSLRREMAGRIRGRIQEIDLFYRVPDLD